MNIIILADKFQKRMKSKGCVGLIRVNKSNILQYQIKYLRKAFGNCNIVYVYGFDGKKFTSYINKDSDLQYNFIPIYNELYHKYNNGYSLSLAKNYLDDECLILFGDNLIDNRVFNRFNPDNNSQIFVAPNIKNRLGCIMLDNKIENISFDLDNYLYEIYYLSKTHCSLIKNMLTDPKYHNHFIFELINKLINQNCIIKPFILNKKNNHEKANSSS